MTRLITKHIFNEHRRRSLDDFLLNLTSDLATLRDFVGLVDHNNTFMNIILPYYVDL